MDPFSNEGASVEGVDDLLYHEMLSCTEWRADCLKLFFYLINELIKEDGNRVEQRTRRNREKNVPDSSWQGLSWDPLPRIASF